MFCPACESDHRDGVVTCPECGDQLVAQPPGHEATEVEEVWRGSDPQRLPLIESVLRDAGIPFVVEGDEILGVFPLDVMTVKVVVPSAQAEAARALLIQIE